jgi:hypothetical protein
MGEVYRGRDTRLNRTIAIKVIPRALSCQSMELSPVWRARPRTSSSFRLAPLERGNPLDFRVQLALDW